jgi:DNA invertase Pin-like site-specific DNA recombinase
MLVGYMRVSKADGSQVNDLQRDALLAAGVDNHHLYEDAASGKRDDRPGLAACMKAMRESDTLIVWKLDRLGRDLRHLVNTVHDLTARGIGFKVLSGHGASIDTTSPSGKLVFGIFAALAEFERELIVERTKAGIADARARGRNGKAPAGDGLDGPEGNHDRRSVRRTGHHTANALPARQPGWIAPARRTKAAGWQACHQQSRRERNHSWIIC